MRSNIITLTGVQGAGKTTVAYHLRSLIPDSVIYDGKREFRRYLENQQDNGIVIIAEYASSIVFPVGHLSEGSIDRFAKCDFIDSQYFQKGKHFFLDVLSEKTQHERLLKRYGGIDNGYIQLMRKEYVYRSQYFRMLANEGYFTKVIVVDDKSIEQITQEIMDEIDWNTHQNP